MKKALSLAMAALLALSLTACGNSGSTAPAESSTPAQETAAPAESVEASTEASSSEAASDTADAGNAALKIAIVSSPSGVDDGSFNEDNYNGILSFIEKNPSSTVTPVKEPTGDTAAAVQAVADIVADYDAIVCCGFQFAGIAQIAQDNPNVKFILVDAFPADPEGVEESIEVENIYAMQFKEQESGFFAGMAAAYETKSNKVAVVNGIAYPSNVNYQYGFECGVKYVNETEGKSVELVELPSYAGTDVHGENVGGNYVGSFADEAAAKEAEGVYIIGCDVDQYDDGANGDANVILTSGLKVMSINVDRALTTIADGSFKGGNVTLGADTDSTGYVKESGRCQLSADTITKIDAAYEKVKAGEIVPAANFNGITPDDFKAE